MRASIKPLNGKYYGTEVELDNGDETSTIVINFRGDGTPSDRELQSSLGCSRAQYDTNDPILYQEDWDREPSMVPAQEAWRDYCCDSHYETKASFDVAETIVNAL